MANFSENHTTNEPIAPISLPIFEEPKALKSGSKVQVYQYVIIGAIVIIGLGLLALFAWKYTMYVFEMRILPIVTDDTEFVIVFEKQDIVNDLPDLIVSILSDLMKVDAQEAELMLDELSQMESDQFGLIIRGRRNYWFAKDPKTAQIPDIIEDEASVSYTHSRREYRNRRYHFWSEKAWPSNMPEQREIKKKYITLMKWADIGLVWPKWSADSEGIASPLFGGFKMNKQTLRLDLAYDVDTIGQQLITEPMPDGSVYINARVWPNQTDAKLSSLDISNVFAYSVWDSLPGELLVEQGNIADFINNPYKEEVIWQVKSRKSADEAKQALNSIVVDLSRRFPQVEERILPDKSVVYELIRDTKLFLEQDSLENSEDEKIITYPDGQISYIYGDEELKITKGEVKSTQPVDNFCILPDFIVKGSIKAGEEESALWKTLNFSYGYSNLAYCFLLN